MPDYARLARTAAGFLRTPDGKRIGAQVLQRAAGAADGLTKQRYSSQIEQARSAAEKGLHGL